MRELTANPRYPLAAVLAPCLFALLLGGAAWGSDPSDDPLDAARQLCTRLETGPDSIAPSLEEQSRIWEFIERLIEEQARTIARGTLEGEEFSRCARTIATWGDAHFRVNYYQASLEPYKFLNASEAQQLAQIKAFKRGLLRRIDAGQFAEDDVKQLRAELPEMRNVYALLNDKSGLNDVLIGEALCNLWSGDTKDAQRLLRTALAAATLLGHQEQLEDTLSLLGLQSLFIVAC